jgi:hypothetical protein
MTDRGTLLLDRPRLGFARSSASTSAGHTGVSATAGPLALPLAELWPASRPRYARAMCGRVRLSSDVGQIKLVFSIPSHRPTSNIVPSWNVARTDPIPVTGETNKPDDTRDHHRTPKR